MNNIEKGFEYEIFIRDLIRKDIKYSYERGSEC